MRGRSGYVIKKENTANYMRRSSPKEEPELITRLRREAYLSGLNVGSFFRPPDMSQAAACHGTKIANTAVGQDVATGTLQIYLN